MTNPWGIPETPSRPEWLTDDLMEKLNAAKLTLDMDGLLMLHQSAKDQLAFWKDEEMELRKITADVLVPAKTEGMNTIELGNGYEAKVGIKYNYTLHSDNDVVEAGLERIANIGNQGAFIADRLVSWKPSFLLTEYRQLQEDAEKGSEFAKAVLKEIESFMTITDAAPTVEVKEPKKKGKK